MSSKQYFEGLAGQWDTLRQSFFSENVREKALAVAGVEANSSARAVDIGAGTGFITEALLAHGVKVIAVDQSEAMLATMRAKFDGKGEVEYRSGDAEHLPIPDQAADYAFANMCLHHVESPAHAIQEMARVLKSGGRLVITDLDEHHFDFLRTELHDRWMGFRREDVKGWLSEAGLRDAKVDGIGEDCSAQSSDGGEQATVTIFVASATR